jgi:probable HAF family extracellular repeat protein
MRNAALFLLLALAGATEAAVPNGNAVFIELPPGALASDVGANGFVVVGSFFSGGGLYWMPTVGVEPVGGVLADAVSRDGKTIVGRALDARGIEHAAIWQGGTDWRLLGSIAANAQPCDLLLSSAFGANDDGNVIVGLAWNGCQIARAFRWEESTGVADLGTLSGRSTRANGVSGDGRVVVGWEESPTGPRVGAKWVDGREELIVGPSGPVGEAHAANRDGSLIVGAGCQLGGVPPTAWTWAQGTGLRCFPVSRPVWAPPLPYQAIMQAVSDDGRVIGGALSFGLDSEAMVWFDGEVLPLRDYLRSHGVPDAFDDWINTGFVTGVSNDGRILVGFGAGPSTFQGYMVVLPALGSK